MPRVSQSLTNNPWITLIRNHNNGEYREQFEGWSDDSKQQFVSACNTVLPNRIEGVVRIFQQCQEVEEMRRGAIQRDNANGGYYVTPNAIANSNIVARNRPDTDIDAWANLHEMVSAPEHEERPEIASEPVSPPEYYSTYMGRPMRVSVDNPSNDEQNEQVREYLRAERERQQERRRREREERRQEQQREAEEQRREQYMFEAMASESFPKPNFSNWSSSRELSRIQQDWLRNVQYRVQWIFERREREGFNRRNIEYFGLSDMESKLRKQRTGSHELDNETSKFYDWSLGGTDWILRLEYLTLNEHTFLIVRSIHKPTNKEVQYEIRHWNGKQFKVHNNLWTTDNSNDNQQNIEEFFNRIKGQLEEYEYEEEDEGEDLIFLHEEEEPSDDEEEDDF